MQLIKVILLIVDKLSESFVNSQMTMENIGLLLRININSDKMTCGKLFTLLENVSDMLNIS